MAFGRRGLHCCLFLLLLCSLKVDGSAVENQNSPPPRNILGKFCIAVFLIQSFGSMAILILLPMGGFSKAFDPNPKINFFHFYLPLLTSVFLSALIAFFCLLLTLRRPDKSVKFSLYLAPALIVLLASAIGWGVATTSFAIGVLLAAVGLCLLAYALWVKDRVPHACQILSVSIQTRRLRSRIGMYVLLAIAAGAGYSSFWAVGIGGVSAFPTKFDALFVFLLLLNLTWVMQVIRNVVHVTISHIEHANHADRPEVQGHDAFRSALGRSFGDVCFGSVAGPFATFVRGTVRGKGLLAGGTDQLCFSFLGCCTSIADWMVGNVNRWGFVHVGAYGKGFLKASKDTWKLFRDQGMVPFIDMDLTGSVCFSCGVAGGALSALVACIWVLVLEKPSFFGAAQESYFMLITAYAFLIGYFIVRIAMAWPQACVSAYYVAYAESKQNNQLDILNQLGSTIPDRIREMQELEQRVREKEMHRGPTVREIFFPEDEYGHP